MANDFIHCNNCLILPSNTTQYYFTQCGRMYCQKCIPLFSTNCSKCSPNVCQSVLLDKSVKPEIQLLFRDLSFSFKQLQKVEEFHKNQRNHLILKLLERNTQLMNELNVQKEVNNKLQNEFISQKELINTFENENKSLKRVIENTNKDMIQENQTNYLNNKTKEKPNKPLFSHLFDFKNQSQLNSNNDNGFEANDSSINRNVNNSEHLSSNRNAFRKPLSPLQSLRGTRISLNPNYSLREDSGIGERQSKTTNGSQMRNASHNWNQFITPITAMSSNPSLSSFATSRPTITPFKRPLNRSTPSTGYSSVMSFTSQPFRDNR